MTAAMAAAELRPPYCHEGYRGGDRDDGAATVLDIVGIDFIDNLLYYG